MIVSHPDIIVADKTATLEALDVPTTLPRPTSALAATAPSSMAISIS